MLSRSCSSLPRVLTPWSARIGKFVFLNPVPGIKNKRPPDKAKAYPEAHRLLSTTTMIADGIAAVRRVYAELDSRPVERNCLRRNECCQFNLTGRTPYLTRGEALVAARAWRATGRKELPVSLNGVCPMFELHSGRCLIYAERPFGCRTHFCAAAGGTLARGEVIDLIRRLETIDTRLGGDGPRKLSAAIETVWRESA